MIIRPRSFPHPVLAPFLDDVTPNEFGFRIDIEPDADNYYIHASFEYDNTTLSQLVKTGAALHALHLECQRNFYRQMFTSTDVTQRLTIPASELVGRVEVSGFIKAQAEIPNYRIHGIHPDYGDAAFPISPGDILAVAESQFFDAFNDYDPLRKISSILTISRSEKPGECRMKLDSTGDRIVATLSQRDYDRYVELKADPRLGALLANQVVVPVLLEAIHEISSTREEELAVEKDKRWFRSILKKLEDMQITIPETPPVEAVQALLDLPLRRSLEGLVRLNPMED